MCGSNCCGDDRVITTREIIKNLKIKVQQIKFFIRQLNNLLENKNEAFLLSECRTIKSHIDSSCYSMEQVEKRLGLILDIFDMRNERNVD